LFWLGDDRKGNYFKVEALGHGLAQYNHRLREACARNDVICIELESLNDRPELFYDEYHFNEAGAREVAELLAKSLHDGETRELR
jgi:hypothetical protein